jgi:hypothetical protein
MMMYIKFWTIVEALSIGYKNCVKHLYSIAYLHDARGKKIIKSAPLPHWLQRLSGVT